MISTNPMPISGRYGNEYYDYIQALLDLKQKHPDTYQLLQEYALVLINTHAAILETLEPEEIFDNNDNDNEDK